MSPTAVSVTACHLASQQREIEMGRFYDLMDRELHIRGLAKNTRQSYLKKMHGFVRHFMRPPDQLTAEHVMQYQLFLTKERCIKWSAFNTPERAHDRDLHPRGGNLRARHQEPPRRHPARCRGRRAVTGVTRGGRGAGTSSPAVVRSLPTVSENHVLWRECRWRLGRHLQAHATSHRYPGPILGRLPSGMMGRTR